jgi:putative ABC transport system substrate-binding protein
MDVIVATGGNEAALAVKRAVTTIPVVVMTGDAGSLVASFDRPGGDLTGISLLTDDLNPKRLELLNEVLPGVAIAVLVNPASPIAASTLKNLDGAARTLRITLRVLEAREPQQIDAAFMAMAKDRADALLVTSDAVFFAQRARILELVAKHRLPAIFEFREFVENVGSENALSCPRHTAWCPPRRRVITR